MTQFLVAIHLPADYDPNVDDPPMRRDIDALNAEMVAAGVRVFVGGLTPPAQAKTIRSGGGATRVIDGPFIEAKEVVGGFWVLELADMDEALAWGRKAVVACRAPVEVRAFN